MEEPRIIRTNTKVNRRRGGHYAIVTVELVVEAREGYLDSDIQEWVEGVIEVGSDE